MRLELTLPALERLIGGDTEIEAGLRRQIVEEFARRHLREVAEQETYKAAAEEVKAHIDRTAKEAFDIDKLMGTHWPTAGDRVASMVRSLLAEKVDKAVEAAVAQSVERWHRHWLDTFQAGVKKAMDRHIEAEIQDGIRKRLEAAKSL